MSDALGPYHEGERAVQRATEEQEGASQNAAMIADAVMPGARSYLQAQRMLVVASHDREERPWASIIFGEPGFVSADHDGQSVTIDRTMAFVSEAEILWTNLKLDAPLGLLAIELSTRRRLRINGHIELLTKERFVLRVEQAYPNCPKYIQRRRLLTMRSHESGKLAALSEGHPPDASLLAAVRKSDTLFVASGHPSRGFDASHRGGPPGFIQILAPDLLRIPDYSGNSMFNTLGNLQIDPLCGLTILDFSENRLYQMTGDAKLRFDGPIENDNPAYTGRYLDFRIQDWRAVNLPVRADWEFIDYSPYNPS
jgi:predicted pyridoxine 5'-phosphate oxidase superfamily flavin-nucleotide-binding protein